MQFHSKETDSVAFFLQGVVVGVVKTVFNSRQKLENNNQVGTTSKYISHLYIYYIQLVRPIIKFDVHLLPCHCSIKQIICEFGVFYIPCDITGWVLKFLKSLRAT